MIFLQHKHENTKFPFEQFVAVAGSQPCSKMHKHKINVIWTCMYSNICIYASMQSKCRSRGRKDAEEAAGIFAEKLLHATNIVAYFFFFNKYTNIQTCEHIFMYVRAICGNSEGGTQSATNYCR
ncbi:unnamed protein product [Ceratitis capitata]|uniref:(Mediterranean fruit fly) hypothetical protein n=1 Tax=Ceratitis capitata TaxID=7213 RepID=A0A811UMK5_CERCA|nr:unnamed protein product [Ceratitis capitata]